MIADDCNLNLGVHGQRDSSSVLCLTIVLLQAEGQLPGLDAPIGGTCTDTCSKSLDGGSGAALVDGVGHVCIPRTEMGTTNHFGSTDSGKCNFVPGGNQTNSGLSTDNFLCVCGFTAQSATSKDQANG